jgi:Protein of unknown function (DUF1275)
MEQGLDHGDFPGALGAQSDTVHRRPEVAGRALATAATTTRTRYDNLGLASLSLASGCIDVLSFLKPGDVFTSAMTGNAALLAIAIGQGSVSRSA